MIGCAKPNPGEMAGFYGRYIDACDAVDLAEALESSWSAFAALVGSIPEERGSYRYADGKWTVKDVLQHVIDTERVMAYRALRFSRNDSTPLPGFEEDDWARSARTANRSISDLFTEADAQRRSTRALFGSMSSDELMRSGTANGQPCTARAAGWIIAGHMLHHTRIIHERYLNHAEA